jgi:hypothetical protein
MRTEEQLNADILIITMKIKMQFPELSKYIEEMPVTIPDKNNPHITLKNLKEYYDSLEVMYKKYVLSHEEKY